MAGGVEITQDLLDCRDVLFKDKTLVKSVLALLAKYSEISEVVLSGGPTMVVDKQYIASALQLVEKGSLCPAH